MPTYNRGGKSLKVMDIGRMATLRQHLLLPGESLNTTITGNVRLAALKQQTSVYLHAQIEAFAQPLRWLYTDFPDYIKEGPAGVKVIPTLTGSWITDFGKTSNLGIGKVTTDFAKWYAQAPINIWNEWYRWPEDAKISVTSPPISFFADYGKECINLPSAPTRLHDAPSIDILEYQVASSTTLDVRELEKIQHRFAHAAKTDWTSQERYQEFMRDVWSAKGSPEVDNVPTRLQKGANLSVTPRDQYASDGPSLGELTSLNNFQVNHKWSKYIAPEHMIVTYIMLLRFAPVFDGGVIPMAYPGDTLRSLVIGDPMVIAGEQPQAVKSREIEGSGDATVIGYLPAAWQYREGFDHTDQKIREQNNFPLLGNQPNTAAGHRDASNISPAFRSTALRHGFADLDFKCNIQSRIPPAGTSIMVGSDGEKGPSGLHPTGGHFI